MYVAVHHVADDHSSCKNVYEVDSYRTRQDPSNPHIMRLDMYGPKCNGPSGAIHYDINKRSMEVYVMNDRGKTIETFRWDPALLEDPDDQTPTTEDFGVPDPPGGREKDGQVA